MCRQLCLQRSVACDFGGERGVALRLAFDPTRGQVVEFAVDKGGDGGGIETHAASPSRCINVSRPRARREVTVPIGTSNMSAASRYA